MEVLLRKASTLARACAQAASKIDVKPLLKLSPHTHADVDHGALLSSTSDLTTKNLDEVIELYQAQSTIRRLIGAANSEIVSPLLAERDFLNSCEKAISGVLDSIHNKKDDSRRMYHTSTAVRVAHVAHLVRTTLISLKERPSASGEIPEVEVPAWTPDTVKLWEARLAQVRRQRSDLMDELAAANLNKKILLPPDVVATLRQHQIIE